MSFVVAYRRRKARTRDRLTIVLREVREDFHRHDVLLAAAGLTFYGVLAVVPLLLLAFWLSGLAIGTDELRSLGATASYLLGGRDQLAEAVDTVIRGGIHPSAMTVVGSALVAAWYGEGLARALRRFSERPMRRPGSRGRLTTPLLVLATATLLTVGLLIGRELTSALGKSAGPTIPRVYLAFVLCWTGLTVNVGLCYLLFGRLRLNASLWWTAAISASWIAGSALGFLLISSWSIDVAAPFAGSRTLGTAALVAVWLYFSHVALLTGYASAIRLSQDRHREGLPITGTGTAIGEPGVGRATIQAGSVRARGAFRSAAVGRTRR